MFKGQAEQDKFVLNMLKNKKKGFFLEIGSNDPININNSYILEKNYEWNGIMIEYSNKWLNDYKNFRPNSIHIINDATKIDYTKLFEVNNVPLNLDYLHLLFHLLLPGMVQWAHKCHGIFLLSIGPIFQFAILFHLHH